MVLYFILILDIFLGHFKSKFGIKRERTKFVYTQQMDYVIKYGQQDDLNNFKHFSNNLPKHIIY